MPRVRGDVIQQHLDARKWTVAKLARAADLANMTVHNIIAGVTTDPSLRTIGNIARALRLKTADLILDEDDDELDPLSIRQLASEV